MTEWNPDLYLKFKNERTQPAIDLLSRITKEKPNRVLDIGCGPGNSTILLKNRWPSAKIYGLDSSAAMIEKAAAEYPDIEWIHMDASDDLSQLGEFDVIFSNAALQWMPDHKNLLHKFLNMLKPEGCFAVQVPYAENMGTFRSLKALSETAAYTEFIDSNCFLSNKPAEYYYSLLSNISTNFSLWRTDYYHIMSSIGDIVNWYRGTGLRPALSKMDENKQVEFLKDYEEELKKYYEPQNDGNLLMPFTRIFFILQK